jgi:uncharacterized protein DUF3631/DNA primase RepB-like protein
MGQIQNAPDIIKGLGGDTKTGDCRCPVPGHGQGRGDRKPSLWISPVGEGIKCHAGCTYKEVISAITAKGIEVRFEGPQRSKSNGSTKPRSTVSQAAADIDEAQRFLNLLDPKAEIWTFQTFSDDGEHPNLADIRHGTLQQHAYWLRRQSKYGAGIFVCPNQTDSQGRKRENIVGIRAISVDLDGGVPLEPVQKCELTPHVIVETSPGRWQAHWRVEGVGLGEFEGIVRGIAKRFGGDANIAELAHCARLPGFDHCKVPQSRRRVRIIEANDGPAYTGEQIRTSFPPVAKPSAAPKVESLILKAQRARAAAIADKYIARDGSAPEVVSDDELEAKIDDLAELTPIAYERVRKEAAKELGIDRVKTLDDAVATRREEVKQHREEAEILQFMVPIEPWPEAVDGDQLLRELSGVPARYLVLPKVAPLTMALWTLHTHAHDCAMHSPNLSFTSPTMQCGKSRALEVLGLLVPQPLPSSNVTVAVIFRVISKYEPTLLLDEMDTYLHSEKKELIGILNSGHRRFGAYSIRCVGDTHDVAPFSTWAPKAFAGIGKIPPTLVDRSIIIPMKRKLADEYVEHLRNDPNAYDELRRKCARWVADHQHELRGAHPVMPEALSDRARDNWAPLLAIAEAVGGDWPQLARQAALSLSSKAGDDQSYPILLLEDMRRLFKKNGGKNMSSTYVVDELNKMETRPWPEFSHGKPITATQVNKLLANFGIKSTQVSVGTRRPNGFTLESKKHVKNKLQVAFDRYLQDRVQNASAASAKPSKPRRAGGKKALHEK